MTPEPSPWQQRKTKPTTTPNLFVGELAAPYDGDETWDAKLDFKSWFCPNYESCEELLSFILLISFGLLGTVTRWQVLRSASDTLKVVECVRWFGGRTPLSACFLLHVNNPESYPGIICPRFYNGSRDQQHDRTSMLNWGEPTSLLMMIIIILQTCNPSD